MINKNAQKKKDIENIFSVFTAQISILKKKRDSVVLAFLKALKEKRLDEIRQSIKRL